MPSRLLTDRLRRERWSRAGPGDWRLVSALILVALNGPIAGAQPRFADDTLNAGIDAPLLQDKPAGGIGVADFNRNGFPDLFLTGYFEPNRLLFNQGDGRFVEVPGIAAQIALPGSKCAGVAVADFDNDGWPDVYLVCNARNYLLRNEAGAGFSDWTTANIDHVERSEAAVWADLTGNGLLDLIIGAHPRTAKPDPADPENFDRILLQQPAGEFVDVAPMLELPLPMRTTLALVAGDFDGDGRIDLYFVNDRHDGNLMLLNRGPGCPGWCFEDVSPASGADRPAYGMGITVGDFDRDGDWDLYYTSMDEQILLKNLQSDAGQHVYTEAQIPAGVDHPGIGWGTIFFDADNDGWEDLFLAISGPSNANEDRIFHNQRDGWFVEVGPDSGLHQLRPTEAAAWVDFDRDGRLDLVLGHSNQNYRLYHNTTTTPSHWIGFRLKGGAGVNRDAIGTRITAQTADGLQQRELRAGESRGASHDRILHFGLGQHDQAEVVIYWPDGLIETVGVLPVGRYHQRVHPAVEIVFSDKF